MQATSECPSLATLATLPYIDADGQLPHQFEGKIGVYAIYSSAPELVYIGYSRDVSLSLKQHLVRQPQHCEGVKVFTVARPNRTLLEDIKTTWVAENGQVPVGNGPSVALWEEPIDVKAKMLPEELAQYVDPQLEDRQHLLILKNAARRIEQEILDILAQRGVQEAIRFNPKLKEQGLLDLK
ncbi:MAG: GIY-YIG nuclease family protein [Thermosynechococcaceae cyanobacterium]